MGCKPAPMSVSATVIYHFAPHEKIRALIQGRSHRLVCAIFLQIHDKSGRLSVINCKTLYDQAKQQ